MNRTNETKNSSNNMDEHLKEAFSYDDKSLLEEFESAAAEYQTYAEEHPEEAEKEKYETAACYGQLMERLATEGLKLMTEKELEKKERVEKKVLRLKKLWKPALVAAAMGAIIFGSQMTISGKKSYEYRPNVRENSVNHVAWNNDEGNIVKVIDVDAAYEEITKQLGIRAVMLGYMPEGMVFEDINMTDGHAKMKFTYQNKTIHFLQIKYPVENSDSVYSTHQSYKTVPNIWLGQEIGIQKNELENGDIEYSMNLEVDSIHYFLCATISEEEFIKIVDGLQYFN